MARLKLSSPRERKKERLRAALIETAQRLFCERGFGATTLDEIARSNDVHVRTVLRYFSGKENLALAPARDGLARFAEMLECRATGETPIFVWRSYVREFWANFHSDAHRAIQYLQMLHEEPALRARLTDLQGGFVETLADGLARADGVDPATDPYSKLLASSVVLASRATGQPLRSRSDIGPVVEELMATIIALERTFPDRATFMREWRRAHAGGAAP